MLGKKVFSELKFEFTSSDSATLPLSALPTVRVNEAFTAGGAGQSGSRSTREIELAQNFDFTIRRKHADARRRAVRGGWVTSTQQQNGNGTYVFQSIDAFNLGQPDTYTLRVGDPLVEYLAGTSRLVPAGRCPASGRNLSVSVGVRQEIQTQVNDAWNLAPRAAFTWTANRKTTVRGGYGIFYDWYDANLYEQTLRVDGQRQYDVIVEDPGFPVISGGGTRLPSSVIRAASLDQPVIQQASIGLERPLTSWAGLRMDYMWTRGSDTLRSVNVNAPADGVRPDPGIGQHHRDSVHGAPRERSPHDRRQRAARAPAHLLERDVSAPELAQLRRLGDQPAVRQHEPGRGLGPVGARTSVTGCS